MRLLVSWVRDFVDVSAPAAEIAAQLALRGFEVASLEPMGDGDAVIDFEVTANRPDCLSVLGLAREIGTVYQLPVREPSDRADAQTPLAAIPTGHSDAVTVTIDDEDLCPRYAAAVAELASAVSPDWMTRRLQASGIRPISPCVDITNYVLMEIGHPMHAFDLDALAGRELRVRRARPGESLTTLDNVERRLDQDMLVIADRDRAQAIAGVMGGGRSEVSATTKTVAFESAYFKPSSVRRTSKKLGLKTEASFRFERGADINLPVAALQRALALMGQLGAGRVVGPLVDRYPRPQKSRHLRLRGAHLTRLLGMDVPPADVLRILRSLGMSVTTAGDGWEVTVPTFRVDVLREIDLIEEVGRHYGFERLEPAFPVMEAPASPPDPRVSRDQLIRRVLTAGGLSEAVTFGFIEAKAAEPFAPEGRLDQLVGLSNPLSAKFDTLRPSLLPGLLDAVARNRRHGRRDVGLFEIGSRFTSGAGERASLALAWTGAAVANHWSGGLRDVDFFDVKGVVEELCDALGGTTRFRPSTQAFLVPGAAAEVLVGGSPVGVIGELTPATAERSGAPALDKIFVGEIDLGLLGQMSTERQEWVQPLPRHPSVVRDASLLVPDTLPAEIIRGTIQASGALGAAPLVGVEFFDRYTGAGVPAGSVSIAVRLTFQAADRTLTDSEVQQGFDTILAALVREHGARQR